MIVENYATSMSPDPPHIQECSPLNSDTEELPTEMFKRLVMGIQDSL